jgi:uracil-DNA glycosylase
MSERTRKEAALIDTYRVGRSLPPLNGSTQYIPGTGDVLSRVVLIGEAPGRDEDRQGEPFVGRAGKLLDSALETIGIPRNSIFLTNVVKYRPPDNRRPTDDEIYDHFPILLREIEIIDPVAVLLLGATALKAVTGSAHISSSRACTLSAPWSAMTMATYHPSFVNYGGMKREAWFAEIENFFETALTFLVGRER